MGLLHGSSYNTLFENNIIYNSLYGIRLSGSCLDNKIYHNNFDENGVHAYLYPGCPANIWDDGYPSGGNYWSDYTGTDTEPDGIGDIPYFIEEDNEDRYPLMTPVNPCTLTINIVGEGSVNLYNQIGPYVYGKRVLLHALPDVGWEFSGWSGDLSGSYNPGYIVMDGDKTVNANFVELTYTLAVNVLGSGSVSLNDTGPYVYGTVVELTANPSADWEFSGWSGNLSGSVNPETILMNEDKTVTATFLELFSLEIMVSEGGSTDPIAGIYEYTYGSEVEVNATPEEHYMLSQWLLNDTDVGDANPYTVTIDADYSLTAVFISIQRSLTLNVVGSGSVTLNPDQATYVNGTNVHLTAIPDEGWAFTAWSGDLSGSVNPETILMDGDKTVNAIFTEIPPEEAIEELTTTIEAWNLPTGTEKSLTGKLDDTLILLDQENKNGAIHKLNDFINQAEVLREKKLTNEQADHATSKARRIINQIQK
jgi:parallel beta-helix repeat protein